ncbi:MAG: hypothetical protein JSV54_08630 [Chloroflexota bacterium]|nr:MAG: hypothetical protein JSV54_08630 [Chloroflexota bacterium]
MVEREVIHVAIAPPATLDQELINRVAAIIAKNLYEARICLTGKIPKIIANSYNMQTAESIALSLRELGLVAIVCTESELRKSPQIYRAHTLKLEEQAILFQDRIGQERRTESGEIFLLIRGRMQTYIET